MIDLVGGGRRPAAVAGVMMAMLVLLGGCSRSNSGDSPPAVSSPGLSSPGLSSSATGSGEGSVPPGFIKAPAIVTFEVAGQEDQQFKVELITQDLVEHARRLLNGESVSGIPIGTVVREDAGPNAPWSWHLDPATFSFAFATIEVCDGIPAYVEDRTVTSPDYCPWSAKVIALTEK